jgi:sarcosine oxidase, subunit alpha
MTRQANRLGPDLGANARIDRTKSIWFTFNGRRYEGFEGDTLASALVANGVQLVARSFKYHRPRGFFGAGAEEPCAMVQVGSGAETLPNLRATQVEIYDGLVANSVNAWPSVNHDVGIINDVMSRLLPAGFYYKTFMWPASWWTTYEHVIRNAAGMGVAPKQPDPDTYDHMHSHCDVLIVGGGPTGLAAALAAGRTGARVIIVDEQSELGGALLANRLVVDDKPGAEWLASALAELDAMEEVRVMPRTTAFGHYDHNHIGLLERRTDHIVPGSRQEGGPGHDITRQRMWKVRAGQVIHAGGAIERSLVFAGNDRPGVMLASAAATYVNRWAARPGQRTVVFTNNDSAYGAAADLADAGMTVQAIVDLREQPGAAALAEASARNIEVLTASCVVETRGKRSVEGVTVMKLNDAGEGVIVGERRFDCDLVAVSGGWSPAVHLHCHAGGKVDYDDVQGCFVPGKTSEAARSAGAANGHFDLADCLDAGWQAGADAAGDTGFRKPGKTPKGPTATAIEVNPPRHVWIIPAKPGDENKVKRFVDLQNDVTDADVRLAAREGYQSVEHLKRYTTLGMGTDQGKTSNIPGLGILAAELEKSLPEVGTTTFRPPYTAITMGAIAGRYTGQMLEPVRRSPMHHWHENHGAAFEDVGQWKRPWYYPHDGEDMQAAVARECLAARNAIGILDATTLGKIDIQGPDASEFLNRIYTNAWSKLAVGRCRYGLMLGEDGMVMDDGVTSCISDNRYLMTTTSGNAASVMGWLEEWLQTEWPDLKVYCNSISEYWATLTISGPFARDLLAELCSDIDISNEGLPFMSWREGTVAGSPARVFRISFTGEVSYEINVPASHGLGLWQALMTAGEKFGITPYGTEAMHVLRAEKGYIIVGQETDGTMTPYDLDMDWIVSKKKPDFIGKRSLSRPDFLRDDRKQLVGLYTEDPLEVLPEGAQIVDDPNAPIPMPMIGHVTSSYMSANLGRSIALAVVKGGIHRKGETVHLPLDNGRTVRAEITGMVFYDPEGERLNG